MRISRKTREQAAVMLAMCASSINSYGHGPVFTWDVCAHQCVPRNVERVALWALNAARERYGVCARYAEAEAMLRTGWSPK